MRLQPEHGSYAGNFFNRLDHKASVPEIIDFLRGLVVDHMGLASIDEAHARPFATELAGFWRSCKDGRPAAGAGEPRRKQPREQKPSHAARGTAAKMLGAPSHMSDLSWIAGHGFRELVRREYDWFFVFTERVGLVVSCPWRLLAHGRIRVSADDDGQKFGLPAPVNAAQVATGLLAGCQIRAVSVRSRALDLVIEFDAVHTLEVFPVSSGYEAWQIDRPSKHYSIIALGGGELSRREYPE